MTTPEIKQYYDATEHREVRADLHLAVSLVGEKKIAINCGCGAGSDIEYLLNKGFKVYGFDVEEESISRCKKRFDNNSDVILSKDTFSSFEYPKSSLVVADASLFFCPKSDFENVWSKISESLYPDGIFFGSFLGPEDTMADDNYNHKAFWKDILVFHEKDLKKIFTDFEIIQFTEHKTSGVTPEGVPHDWHLFSVIAKKTNNKSNNV